MPYDQETGIPLHPTVDIGRAKLWLAPVGWTGLRQNWGQSDEPGKLEPILLSKTKYNDNQLFSTLGGYALYRSDEPSKKYIYKSTCEKSKIKFCLDHAGKWMVVKTISHGNNDDLNDFTKREAFFLARLGRLKAFYARETAEGFLKHYIVMDWIEGVSLTNYLPTVADLSFLERLQEARSILKSLIDLNSQGILHGDIHSGNLIRRHDGEYVFIDFENSKLEDSAMADEFDEIHSEIFNHLFSEGELEIIGEMREELKDKMHYEGMLNTAQKRQVYLKGFDRLIKERSDKKLKYE